MSPNENNNSRSRCLKSYSTERKPNVHIKYLITVFLIYGELENMNKLIHFIFFLDYTGQSFTGYNIDLNTGNSLDYNPGSNAGYNPDYSPGYSSSSNDGFCGFLGKFLMCQCTEEAICEENLIPYGYCPMHPMMPMVRTQCCPKSYVMMCSQQHNPYETQGGSYFLMMQSAANREL